MDILTRKLNERIKELRCIYSVEEALAQPWPDLESLLRKLLDIIPGGWQFTTVCEACITFEDREYFRPEFIRTPWVQRAELVVDNCLVGELSVYYIQKIDKTSGMLFLPEEQKLLGAIADRLGHYIFFQRLKNTIEYLDAPVSSSAQEKKLLSVNPDIHWKWRYRMAERIAGHMDMDRFGVKAVYLIGSTKAATAGYNSDIDLLVHFNGNESQEKELRAWMEGWGLCIAEINYLKTGFNVNGGLIDLHIITDEDIRKKTSYAVMTGHGQANARLLRKKE